MNAALTIIRVMLIGIGFCAAVWLLWLGITKALVRFGMSNEYDEAHIVSAIITMILTVLFVIGVALAAEQAQIINELPQ